MNQSISNKMRTHRVFSQIWERPNVFVKKSVPNFWMEVLTKDELANIAAVEKIETPIIAYT